MDEENPRKQYRLTKIMRTHEAPVHSVNFFRNEPGRVSAVGGASSAGVVATAAWDAYIHVYDLDQHDKAALVRTLGDHEEEDDENTIRMGGLYDVKFSGTCPNILAAASADNFVYLWNYHTNQMITRLKGHKDEVNGVAFHAVQQVLCSTSDDCAAIIWDIHEGVHLRTLTNHCKAAYGATFMGADNPYEVVTCSFDHKVRVYDMREPAVIATLQEHEDDVVGLDFTEKRHWLASGSDDGCVCVWDNRVWDKPLFKIDTRKYDGMSGNEVKRVKFNPSGTKLAAGCSELQAHVYMLTESSPRLYGILDGNNPHKETIFDVCFCVDAHGNEFVVDASHDETCYVWRDEHFGHRPRRRTGHEKEGHGVAGGLLSFSI
jgi:WD40 repeat protein